MEYSPAFLGVSIAFFVLAVLFCRQHKVVDQLKQANVDLKVRLEFAKIEIDFAKVKYTEMSDFVEEQINRAESAEAKLKNEGGAK